MARYRLRYVTYATEQLRHLPGPLRTAYVARIEDLASGSASNGMWLLIDTHDVHILTLGSANDVPGR